MAPKDNTVALTDSSSSCSQIISSISLNKNRDICGEQSYSIVDDDTNDDNDDVQESPLSFFPFLNNSSGPLQIIFLAIVYATAMGSTIAVVPAIMTTQYARIRHGLDINLSCSNIDKNIQACLDGNDDALTAATLSSFTSNIAVFFTSSFVGSVSDEIGRRYVMLVALGLALLPRLALVVLQLYPMGNPAWYYVAYASSNLVSWTTIALSAISDVIPSRWRASCFGLIFGGISIGLAISPLLVLPLSEFGVSLLSLSLLTTIFLYSIFFLPETLSKDTSDETRRLRLAAEADEIRLTLQDHEYFLMSDDGDITSSLDSFQNRCRRRQIILSRILLRPFRDLLILNKNTFFHLLAALAFFSGMSTSGDQTLIVYYAEQRLGFNDQDIAYLFLIIGLLGIIIQFLLLNRMIYWLGERTVVIIAFISGALHNSVYAFATEKSSIFIGAAIGCAALMAFPTISAIKANSVDEHEQGKIQGALYAISSLASALGPASLRLVYQKTKNTSYPGSFFLVATIFFSIATVCAIALPKTMANTNQIDSRSDNNDCSRRLNSHEHDDVSISNSINEGGHDV